MRQDAQKQSRKFCRSKEGKNSETHPIQPEKGETGCVLGAGGGSSGWRRMRADGKGRSEQGRGGRLLLSLAKMEGRTCLACWLGQLAAERHWRSLTPRHAPQAGLRAHLVAKSYRTLTKKSGTAEAIPDFFGRGRRTWSRLPPRSVRGRAPLALAHPTTRTA